MTPANILTFSRQLVNPLEPETVLIYDIAHSLGLICRYGGHCPVHYSVAQHSVIVAHAVNRALDNRSPNIPVPERIERYLLPALLHDAHEAYMGDIVTPAKDNEPALRRVEEVCATRVRAALGVDEPNDLIHQMDREVGACERDLFWNRLKVDWVLSAGSAWVPFLSMYHGLRHGYIMPEPHYIDLFAPAFITRI